MWYIKTTAILVLVIYTISSVQCQTQAPSNQTALREEIRANLTRMVQFVIHPTAVASEEIIDFALSKGGRPKTLMERIAYLDYIKKIARTMPVYMATFTKTVTQPDGTTVEQIDEAAFDDAITKKAQEYSLKRRAQEAKEAVESRITTGTTVVPGNQLAIGTGNVMSNSVAGQQPQNPPSIVASDGTVSLLDMFRVAQYNRMMNQLNP